MRSEIPFLIFAALTLVSSLSAMMLRNLVHCALCVAGSFVGLAAIYLKLDAEFVGFALGLGVGEAHGFTYRRKPTGFRSRNLGTRMKCLFEACALAGGFVKEDSGRSSYIERFDRRVHRNMDLML